MYAQIMADASDIKAIKSKRNTLREKLEKRKKERNEILSEKFDDESQSGIKKDIEIDIEVEKVVLQILSVPNVAIPIISTQFAGEAQRCLKKFISLDMINCILDKLRNHEAIEIRAVSIGPRAGFEVHAVETDKIKKIYKELMSDDDNSSDEFKLKFNDDEDSDSDEPQRKTMKTNETLNADGPDDIMSLLTMPSSREKESKQVGEEILELLTKPTAKERSVAEKFKSHGGAQVMEFCPHGTKIECVKAHEAKAEMEAKKRRDIRKAQKAKEKLEKEKLEKVREEQEKLERERLKKERKERGKKDDDAAQGGESGAEDGEIFSDIFKDCEVISQPSTDESETPPDVDNCSKLHFKKILQSHTDESLGDCSFLNTCFHMATCKYVHYEVDTLPNINTNKPADVKTNSSIIRSIDSTTTLYPPQWIQCDLRYLDMTVLGKFAVVMADPPWDIHMELPYGTMSDDEMRQLGVPALQDHGLIFLWVTGRAMELGRECLRLWGYERVDELIWVKTNQLQRIIRTGRTGHWLNHGKEHCLVGMKGDPKDLNRGLDCDVIVAEVRATSHKPDEIYGIIERLSPGTRKIELFGRPHNIQPNWITLGNQLDGIRLVDPELITQFQKRYPDGNCMSPAPSTSKSTVATVNVGTK